MKTLLVGVLLFALVGCGGEDLEQIRAEAREGMVDECYKEQAAAFQDAAEAARDSIQTYMPEILGAAADRDLAGIESAGAEFMATGAHFEDLMSQAEAVC